VAEVVVAQLMALEDQEQVAQEAVELVNNLIHQQVIQ
jgi:hypothetical protein